MIKILRERYTAEDFFTKDELVEFSNDIEDRINGIFELKGIKKFVVTNLWLDKSKLFIEISNDDYVFDNSVNIDLRKIKKPSDIYKYFDYFVNKFVKDYNEIINVED